MIERIEKISATLAKLSDRYDVDALLEGVVAVVERAARALEDGRLSVGEAIGIGLALMQLVKAAAKAG